MATTYRLHIYDITGLDFGTCHSSIVGLLLLFLLDLLYQKRCPSNTLKCARLHTTKNNSLTFVIFINDGIIHSFIHVSMIKRFTDTIVFACLLASFFVWWFVVVNFSCADSNFVRHSL